MVRDEFKWIFASELDPAECNSKNANEIKVGAASHEQHVARIVRPGRK